MKYDKRVSDQMNEDRLRQVFQSLRHQDSSRGLFCPDENRLAEYAEGQLSAESRTALEKHLSGCDSCLASLAFLVKSAEWPNPDEAPGYLVARARGLVTEKRPVWKIRWATASAAVAALLLLVFGFFIFQRMREPANPVESVAVVQKQEKPPIEVRAPQEVESPTANAPPRPAPTSAKPNINTQRVPTLRGNETSRPRLLFPREGASLRRDELEFRWEPVPSASSYTIRLVTADGSLKSEIETKETSLRLSDEAQLEVGAAYYVTVVAHGTDGQAQRSEIVRFRIAKN